MLTRLRNMLFPTHMKDVQNPPQTPPPGYLPPSPPTATEMMQQKEREILRRQFDNAMNQDIVRSVMGQRSGLAGGMYGGITNQSAAVAGSVGAAVPPPPEPGEKETRSIDEMLAAADRMGYSVEFKHNKAPVLGSHEYEVLMTLRTPRGSTVAARGTSSKSLRNAIAHSLAEAEAFFAGYTMLKG